MASEPSTSVTNTVKCRSCDTEQSESKFCTQCGDPLIYPVKPVQTKAFAGAERAAGYVESEHTELATEVRAQVAAAALPAAIATELPPAESELDDLSPIVELEQSPVSLADAPATTGLRGALTSLGIRMKPSAAELEERARTAARSHDEDVVRQATFTRAVSVLVANRKGGVGKTPVALLLGGALASVRGGSVAVVEVSDDPGALAFRAEGSPKLGIGELVTDAHGIRTAGQLAGYTAPQTSYAAVIGSPNARNPLSGEDVAAISHLVDDYYSIRVMDSGNLHSSPAFLQAVAAADALVVPTLNAADSVLEAVNLLDALRAAGGHSADLAERAILIRLTDGRYEHPQVLERISRVIDKAGFLATFEVPYDVHIAERGQLTLANLSPDARDSFTAAAAGVVRSLQNHIR